MAGERAGAAARAADQRPGRRSRRRPRPAGTVVRRAVHGTARDLRAPPPSRAAARRDRRDAGDPAGNGAFTPSLRDARAPRGARHRHRDAPGRRGAAGMNDMRFERRARAWVEDGPSSAPAETVAAILSALETAPQRPALVAPLRALDGLTHRDPL